MRVTVLTDASYSHEHKKGGWACWIRYDDKALITYAAAFKDTLPNSYEAERKAVINAVFVAIKKAAKPLTSILVQTDCLQVVQKLTIRDIAREIPGVFVPPVKIVHVKGHKYNSKETRHWCNQWCDKQARKRMREACREVRPC